MSLPYFAMYPGDFEAKTSHLTLEEDGAYNRLLRLMWMTPGCSLPDDPAWIARRMRCDQATYDRVVAPLIDEFLRRKNGRVYSPRLTEEFEKVDGTSRRRSDAGKKGGRPKATENAGKSEKPGFSFDKGGLSDTRALPEPEPERDTNVSLTARDPDRFDEFWQAYPAKGRTGRKAAAAKFALAVKSGVDPKRIVSAAKAYGRTDQVQRGYAKNALTWLNQGCWDDELPGMALEPVADFWTGKVLSQ